MNNQLFLAQAVPSILTNKRETVDLFVAQLAKYGMPMQAVFTRNAAGRAVLVAARRQAGVNLAVCNTTQTRRFSQRASGLARRVQ